MDSIGRMLLRGETDSLTLPPESGQVAVGERAGRFEVSLQTSGAI